MKRSTLLTLSNSGVRFDRCDGDFYFENIDDKHTSNVAEVVYKGLKRNGWHQDRLILGIDSTKVYFLEAEVSPNLINDQEALCYELEARLPMDAETIAAICIGSSQDTNSFLVWDTAGVAELAKSLSLEYELSLSAFVPVELSIAEQERESRRGEQTTRLLNGERTEQFCWDNNRLVSWTYHPSGDQPMDSKGNPDLNLVDSEKRSTVLKELLSGGERTIRNLNCDFSEVVPFGGSSVGSIWEPLLMGCLVFLICVFSSLIWKSIQAEDSVKSAEAQIVANFRKQFPDRKINGPVNKLLESELGEAQKLAGLESHPKTSERLLVSLKKTLAGFDQKIRFQINSLTIEQDAVLVSGKVKSFSDFQSLKETFGKRGFDVDPESTFGEPFTISLKPRLISETGGQL